MQKDFIDNIEKMNKASVEAIKRLGEIQLKSIERLTEVQVEATTEAMNEAVKQMQSLAGSKDVQSVVDLQAKFIAQLNERAVENAKKTAEVLTETKGELTEWVEAGVKAASDTPFAKAVTAAGKRAA